MRVLDVLLLLALAAALPAQPEVAGPVHLPYTGVEAAVPPLLERGHTPGVLFQTLSPEDTGRLHHGRVQSFPEEKWKENSSLRFRVQSLGLIDAAPETVIKVLSDVHRYPGWMTLSPSYKSVFPIAENRLRLGLGKSDQEDVKSYAVYSVHTSGNSEFLWSVLWRFEEKVRAFQPGSFIHYTVQAHPDEPGKTLLLHTQETRITGMLAKRYLSGEAGDYGTRHRKDAVKHARRIHWAIAVAAQGLQGDMAWYSYSRHYRREFGHYPPGWEAPKKKARQAGGPER